MLFCNCFHNFDIQKPFRNANQSPSSFLPIPSSFSPSIPVNPSYFLFYSKLFILFLNTRPPASSLSRFIHCSLSISLALTIHHCKSCKSQWNCRLIPTSQTSRCTELWLSIKPLCVRLKDMLWSAAIQYKTSQCCGWRSGIFCWSFCANLILPNVALSHWSR